MWAGCTSDCRGRDVQPRPGQALLELSYANGDREVLYFKDFASGAMIESIARRAKKLALKR
jgi:proteasome-associated ATPase